jgi:hypothetical protein
VRGMRGDKVAKAGKPVPLVGSAHPTLLRWAIRGWRIGRILVSMIMCDAAFMTLGGRRILPFGV